MTMGDLYEEMKASLKFLGLSFGDMHKVEMTSGEGYVQFSHGGRTVKIDTTGDVACP